jgi:hypothetical protein
MNIAEEVQASWISFSAGKGNRRAGKYHRKELLLAGSAAKKVNVYSKMGVEDNDSRHYELAMAGV